VGLQRTSLPPEVAAVIDGRRGFAPLPPSIDRVVKPPKKARNVRIQIDVSDPLGNTISRTHELTLPR
jgi:hypothetical protein